ncbi:MAG: anti-sigma factor [Cyanobacteria bacterium P01_C01_bin.147]
MTQSLSNEEQALAAGYVLGDLTPEEAAQVAQLLDTKPAMQQEVDALRVSLRLIPHASEMVMPPAHLEEKVMNAYAASEINAASAANAVAAAPSLPARRSWSGAKILAVLSIPALLLLAMDNLRLRRQFSLAQGDRNPEVAAILQQPQSRLVSLQGNDSGGTLLFTPGQWEQVVVSVTDLPPLPPEQIYRMWLTLDNGELFFCGEFTTDESGSVFITLNPPDSIPQGVKAQEVFVTQADVTAPLDSVGEPIIVGEI